MAFDRRLPPVRTDQFSMVARPDVPRSLFKTRHTHKTTFDADYLVPIYVDEVLPGDHIKGDATIFLRMSTPIFPVMDNIHAETFFFFVPNRILWDNWVKFMGERKSPNDSIDFLVPQIQCGNGTDGTGFDELTVGDYFGLPIKGELTGSTPGNYKYVNSLPFRAYNLIWNEWFRSQDLQSPRTVDTGDGPDNGGAYAPMAKRGRKHDYFTSALPWPVKGGAEVSLPVGGAAPVKTSGTVQYAASTFGVKFGRVAGGDAAGIARFGVGALTDDGTTPSGTLNNVFPTNLYADLSEATGATLNAMRIAVATQHLLERDARGGTRYTELLKNHFGVDPQDSRLQRPEYIGGGHFTLQTQAIPQTSGTPNDPDTGYTSTPLGELGAATIGNGNSEISYSATEHGVIIGLMNVYADITYQRGIHRMWTRQTRYDFYWPTFAFLGEQAIRNDEIFATGQASDTGVFGYQERWAEYRHKPGRITGKFRSNATGSLDAWHLADDYASLPSLNNVFITQNNPMARVLAAGSLAAGQQFLMDSVFEISMTRALPMRSVPGLTRF